MDRNNETDFVLRYACICEQTEEQRKQSGNSKCQSKVELKQSSNKNFRNI